MERVNEYFVVTMYKTTQEHSVERVYLRVLFKNKFRVTLARRSAQRFDSESEAFEAATACEALDVTEGKYHFGVAKVVETETDIA